MISVLFSTYSFSSPDIVVELQIFPSGCLINLDGHIDFLSMIDLLVSETGERESGFSARHAYKLTCYYS